jgi:hypothetical protein
MANETPRGQDPKFERRVVQWLLDSDPSIRWQVMRDLTEEPDELVTAERSRVASEGWGTRLLALQGPDGKWGDGTITPPNPNPTSGPPRPSSWWQRGDTRTGDGRWATCNPIRSASTWRARRARPAAGSLCAP